jgi:RNA polymerase sigma-70 factor (ECF subfamily)
MEAAADKELLVKIRDGDKTAFTLLYTKYKHRLFAYCYRLIPNQQNAEDVVQTTFIKAFESLGSLDKPELFYYWLFSIARNEVYAFLRHKRSNGVTRSIGEEQPIWDDETPLDIVLKEETVDLVQRLLGQLKIEYRETLILRQYEKLSYAEIAAITGDTVSSVESRLFKARKALAKKLGPYFK